MSWLLSKSLNSSPESWEDLSNLLKSCFLASPFWEVQVQYLTRQRCWNGFNHRFRSLCFEKSRNSICPKYEVETECLLIQTLIWTEMIQKSGILLQNCKPTWPLSHFSCRKCIFAYHFAKIDTLKTVSFLAALRKTWIWWNNC